MSSTPTNVTDTTLITVVGSPGQVPYHKVKNAVVNRGGVYYYKSDMDNLCVVIGLDGKKGYFRKTSKLVVELSPGQYVHRNNVVYTVDNVPLDKTCPSTIMIDGQYTRKEFTLEIDGVRYLRSDKRLVTCCISGEVILKTNAIELSVKHYGLFNYVHTKYLHQSVIPTKTGDIVYKKHTRDVLSRSGELEHYHTADLPDKLQPNVFLKFKDVTNPQLDRIDLTHVFQRDADQLVQVPYLNCHIHKAHVDFVNKIYSTVYLVQQAEHTKTIKKLLVYADDGPDENMAKLVKKIAQPWPGKHNIFTPAAWGKSFVPSRSKALLGGLSYTFGVELETSQGQISNKLAEQLYVKLVGDRSIGSAEYVSPVLHGDDGVRWLEDVCKALAEHTFVDDRCGVHIHVGGMQGVNGVAAGDFDRYFSQNAIKLGCQIEEELYRTLPPSRNPLMKHCHSIRRWSDINDTNWREYLGAYVFGPEENWGDKLWSFKPYSYGKDGMSKADKVDTWCGGRYKWLNLVHILTKSSFSTCELRIFPGSTNFDKIYNYLLTSLAFVWFVENRPGLIAKGSVTLNDMLTAPFERHPEIGKRLVDFYEARKNRFKRDKIYTVDVPKAIF